MQKLKLSNATQQRVNQNWAATVEKCSKFLMNLDWEKMSGKLILPEGQSKAILYSMQIMKIHAAPHQLKAEETGQPDTLTLVLNQLNQSVRVIQETKTAALANETQSPDVLGKMLCDRYLTRPPTPAPSATHTSQNSDIQQSNLNSSVRVVS